MSTSEWPGCAPRQSKGHDTAPPVFRSRFSKSHYLRKQPPCIIAPRPTGFRFSWLQPLFFFTAAVVHACGKTWEAAACPGLDAHALVAESAEVSGVAVLWHDGQQ